MTTNEKIHAMIFVAGTLRPGIVRRVQAYDSDPAACLFLLEWLAQKRWMVMVTYLKGKPFAKVWDTDERYWTASGETIQQAIAEAVVASETK